MMLAALTPAATPEPELIKDIAPPVPVPYPLWIVALAVVAALVLLGLIVWGIVRAMKNRPAPPPLTAQEIALRELEKLRAQLQQLDPYRFSIAVSDVLRTFIGDAKFHLPATRQTSPEVLAAVSHSPLFGAEDRELLARFLEKCDMIKFARIDATSQDSADLLASACAFVQGGRA